MITVPDYQLDDTYADARDAYDLEIEAKRKTAWDEILSDDGDISGVMDLLTEYPEDVLPLMRAYRNGNCMKRAAHRLGARLDLLTESVIEEGL